MRKMKIYQKFNDQRIPIVAIGIKGNSKRFGIIFDAGLAIKTIIPRRAGLDAG